MVVTRFLLVSLSMNAILAEATIRRRRQALQRVIRGLSLQDVYSTTLDRIKQQGGSKSKLGMEALMWISHSERPLGSQELCHALGVELGAEDFNIQNVPSIRTVLQCTLGLVAVDKKASTPRLLHFTLQEYLRQHPTLFSTAHSIMAETCLTYLNCPLVRALPLKHANAPRTRPFLEYTTCFWGAHAGKGVTEPVKYLALRLLDGHENHISAPILLRRKLNRRGLMGDFEGISGLHCIAFWGIEEIAIAMLEIKRWQIDGRDSYGETPTMWAIEHRNTRIVELFLNRVNIEPGTATKDHCTVFSFAAWLGDEDVVKRLLERGGVCPNSPDCKGQTPLLLAAMGGREGVVRLLLERRNVNPDLPDSNGRTPLSFAAWRGNEGVVRILLGRGGVNPNSSDRDGRTPLFFAAMGGHEGVMRLLLERGSVDPNSRDSNGRTPLSFAASGGQEFLMDLLSEGDELAAEGCVNPYSSRWTGTWMAFATGAGGEGAVKLLLEDRNVDPDSSDRNGRTPLSFAASGGHGGVANLILEHKDVNPNSHDTNDRTPLSFAALGGHEGVVKLLLERGDIDPNSPDSNGRTPLSFAASGGHRGVVTLFMKRRDVNPNSLDSNGRTPFLRSANIGIAKLILARGDVDPGWKEMIRRSRRS